jgi:hypothetical protein
LEQEDPSTVQREWQVQRVGWAVLVAIVVAALAGVFGTGPLSWTRATADDASLVVDYSRFAREGGSISLVVHFPPGAIDGDEVRVRTDNALLQGIEVEQITPEPSSQSSVDGGVVFTFDVEPGAGLEATIAGTADTSGFRNGAIGLDGRDPLELWQVFYP